MGPMVRRGVRRHVLATLLLAVSIATAACSATAPSPPTGVDTLEIPTPSPEPEDFVAEVDNRWFPLPAGAEWVYSVADESTVYELVVTVEQGPDVLGVATTAVHTEPLAEPEQQVEATARTDWYAQDTAGNVWWFGTEGEWRAGEDGARAGLAMPAEPRFGDGFRMAPDVRAEVTAVDADAGTLELEVHRGAGSRTEEYAAGIGLQSWLAAAPGTAGTLVRHDLDG